MNNVAVAQELDVPQLSLFGTTRQLVRPPLKWAGGKTRLLPVLRRSIPQAFGTYFEPFMGGAALFFDTSPQTAVLGDSNPELINFYEVLRDSPELLIEHLERLTVSEAEFYRTRALEPLNLTPVERATRILYLNKTCFNGLYRVNKRGEFNTPFGKQTKVNLFDRENLLAASNALQFAKLKCADYLTIVKDARRGDFVYFDPPYVPVSKFSDFKRYTKEFFSEEDQEELAAAFTALAERGCYVLLSNSFQDETALRYAHFRQQKVFMPRFVNCKGDGRGNVTELLISNYEPQI
ncbi:MAG: DNA adenine methylase [Terracidiphilus sp.]